MQAENLSNRCPTGIPGFDKLIEGGLPQGRTILLTGACGTGKTVFGTQFLYNGAAHHGEPGILVLLEQNPDEFRSDMMDFNFDLKKLEEEKKLIVIDASLSQMSCGGVTSEVPISSTSFSLLPGETSLRNLIDVITRAAETIDAKRVVLDSLPSLDLMVEDKKNARKIILNMNYKLKAAGLTSLLISELSPDLNTSTHGVEKYVVDGVVTLHYKTFGPDAGRLITIDKMRRTHHSEDIHIIKFERGTGLRVVEE